MKNVVIFTVTLGLVFAAAAAQARAPSAVSVPSARESVAAETSSAEQANEARNDATCLRETGSRVVRKGQKCNAGIGRSYSRSDISGTGSLDLREALRRLDTSVY